MADQEGKNEDVASERPVEDKPDDASGSAPESRRRLLRLSSDHLAQMGPETALVEFISASAAYFNVKKQNVAELEFDLLKVSPGNVMPANAAAWYMGKKNAYANASGPNLLNVLLKHYPRKFRMDDKEISVEFLDTYFRPTAKKKLDHMVEIGLISYFTHKANEFGVYFFDPNYYEATEPYCTSLNQCNSNANRSLFFKSSASHEDKEGTGGEESKSDNDEKEEKKNGSKKFKGSPIDRFFAKHPNLFTLKRLSPSLATLTKATEEHETILDQTAVIVSMVDNKFGLLQFRVGDTTEKALFAAKALFNRGKPFDEDPLKMPPVKFDGFRVKPHDLGSKFGDCQYSWYAVLVWVGTKPNPKYCVSREELASSPYFRDKQPIQRKPGPKTAATNNEGLGGMLVGEVLEIRSNGAVVTTDKNGDGRAFIPGWANTNKDIKSTRFLVTTQGVELTLKDLIAYYAEPNSSFEGVSDVVGCNVMVLKHGNGDLVGGRKLSLGNDAHLLENKEQPDGATTSKVTKSKKKGGNSRHRSSSRSEKTSNEESDDTESLDKDKKGKEMRPSGNNVHYAQFLLTAELEEEKDYNSDTDPGYDPARDPKAIELLCDHEDYIDFDEYSEGEISGSELDAVIQDAEDESLDLEKLRKALKEVDCKDKSEQNEPKEIQGATEVKDTHGDETVGTVADQGGDVKAQDESSTQQTEEPKEENKEDGPSEAKVDGPSEPQVTTTSEA